MSSPGSVSFASKVDFGTGSATFCVEAEDIDGDGKIDVGVNGNGVSMLKNNSTVGNISFEPYALISSFAGIDIQFSDLDGDYQPDMILGRNSNLFNVRRNIIEGPQIVSITESGTCGSGSVTLSAVPSSGLVNWYSNLTGGASLATGNSFTTPVIGTSTTYYAEATDGSCPVLARTEVEASVSNVSADAGLNSSICSGGQPLLGGFLWQVEEKLLYVCMG